MAARTGSFVPTLPSLTGGSLVRHGVSLPGSAGAVVVQAPTAKTFFGASVPSATTYPKVP